MKLHLPVFVLSHEEEIRRLILIHLLGSKSCELDPIPTHLLIACVDVLVMPITLLVNKCLVAGFFRSVFKNACVIPVLKKNSLCKEDMENYRPSVSNLSYVLQVVENVASNRILSHVAD